MGKRIIYFLSILTVVIFFSISNSTAGEILIHNAVKIITKNSLEIKGWYESGTADSLTLKKFTGEYISLSRSDISEVYKKEKLSRRGFVVGFFSGVFIGRALGSKSSAKDIIFVSRLFAFGVACGIFTGYVGSHFNFYNTADIDDFSLTKVGKYTVRDDGIFINLAWNF
ncbi:MAG: hypothetical protein V3V99_14385 [candidate division Zixibacteria bacterium]